MARILIVDDERDVAQMIHYMLRRDKHIIDTAHDGIEALAVLGVEPNDGSRPMPDLVLLDVMMPAMDGYEFCDRLQEHERTRMLPVILLTARGALSDPHRHTRNVVGHLDKPFDPQRLRKLVAATLERLG